MMPGRIYYELHAPACGTCGRKDTLDTQISLPLAAKTMLVGANFQDWAVWEEKSAMFVAPHFQHVVDNLNRDAKYFVNLVDDHRVAWELYGECITSMTEFYEACLRIPQGYVKVVT